MFAVWLCRFVCTKTGQNPDQISGKMAKRAATGLSQHKMMVVSCDFDGFFVNLSDFACMYEDEAVNAY